ESPTVLSVAFKDEKRRLSTYTLPSYQINGYAQAAIVADWRRLSYVHTDAECAKFTSTLKVGQFQAQLAIIDDPEAEIAVINGSLADAILDAGGDLLLLQKSVRPGNICLVRRLGTTLGAKISRTLFTGGINELLALNTQRGLGEAPL